MTPHRTLAGRGGASAVEALVSLLLTALLLQMSWSLTASVRRTAARFVERSEALDVERVGWHVLRSEAGAGLPGRDWTVEGGRVLSLRAFRGTGEVCEPLSGPTGGVVRYGGMRLPEPNKDSLLVLDGGGVWQAAKLVSRTAGATPCPGWPEGPVERWEWDPPVQSALLARVFERGSYHLEDRAVRYRVGEGGRQPLTAERLRDAGSGFLFSGGALELRLRVEAGDGVTWESTRVLSREEPAGG